MTGTHNVCPWPEDQASTCGVCKGAGAKVLPGPNGEPQFELVGDCDRGRKGWLRSRGYEDRSIAPCDGCGGIGFRRKRPKVAETTDERSRQS